MTRPCITHHHACDCREARFRALEQGIRDFLAGNYARPVGTIWRADGEPSKHDRCVHGVWLYGSCEACIDAHFERVLEGAQE